MQFKFDEEDLERIREIIREENRALLAEAMAAFQVEPENGNLLNVKQAAAMLGVSTSTIWNYTRSGKLQKQHIGDAVRFYPDDIRALIK